MTAGTKVVLIDDPSRVGEATGRIQNRGPFTYIEVRFGPQEVKPVRAEFLQVFSQGEVSSDERIRNGQWGKADDLRRLLTFEKLRGCLHDFLYSMDAARIDFHEYQFKPVLKFINSPTERLLIADEVGLGKTIEASLIWLEMQARHDARRLLVVCPNMLAQKWRQELRDRFGVPAEVGSAENLLFALNDLRRRTDTGRFAWICTYSGLRPFRKDIDDLEADQGERTSRGKLFHECYGWSAEEPFFDLAIFDEAHYMRNAASLTSKLGAAINNAARATLLVSATPVNNSNADLLTLLRLLDPDFFDSQPLFDTLLAENRPAVQAVSHLGAPRPRIAEALASLRELRQSSFVGESPLLARALSYLEKLSPNDPRALIEAIETVDQLNVLGGYVSRTRRVQVKERRPRRTPLIQTVKFCAEEMEFYETVTKMVRQRVARSGSRFSAFHLTLPQQRMASCIPAVIEAMNSGGFLDSNEILSESFNVEASENFAEEEPETKEAVRSLMRFDFERVDSKYRELNRLLRREFAAEKVILFAYFKGTLRYLLRRLRAQGIGCAIIHGDIDSEERLNEIDRFRDDASVRVLLSSEVGAEGIDLQFCRVVINYDLPWNPMRLEQRIGRIDRIGQKSDRLSIVHFKVLETIEERLYERLHQKLGIFENSIGDLEAILGEEMQQLTLDLFAANLTPREEEERIELTRLALENKLRLMQQLEQEGESLIAFSDLIAGRVEQNRELGRYVTADELQRYIADFFARNYKGCVLEWNAPAPRCFRLELTFTAHDRMGDFIRTSRLQASEFRGRKLIGTLFGETSSETAGSSKDRPVFINHLSGLVRWITAENGQQPGAFYRLSALMLECADLPAGDYAFRIERWSFKGLRNKEILAYGVGHIKSGRVQLSTEAEEFMGRVLREGASWPYPDLAAEDVLTALNAVGQQMNDCYGAALLGFEAENENLRAIKVTQKRGHFSRRRLADEQRLATALAKHRASHQVRMFEGKLVKLAELEESEVHKIERKAMIKDEPNEVSCGIVRITPKHSP